jgi:hypothetical protein
MYSKQRKAGHQSPKDFDRFTGDGLRGEEVRDHTRGRDAEAPHAVHAHAPRGLDAAIQIGSARVDGSLKRAPLKESISWGKLKGEKMDMTATIFGSHAILPLI